MIGSTWRMPHGQMDNDRRDVVDGGGGVEVGVGVIRGFPNL